MSVVEVLNVKLQRTEPSVSWGFNVQGGKEFHCPLMIQKVNPGSLAERCSIQPNDYILRIGSLSTEHLTHNQARDSIVRQGNNLELTLQRGAVPRPDDYHAKMEFPQHQLMNPENLQQPKLSPQVGVQLSKNKALLTQSYNSPMGLYSSQNIADTLVNSMKGCSSVGSSTSVSPVSDSSGSNFDNHYLGNHHRRSVDLNTRPRPFVPRRSSVTLINDDSSKIRQCSFEIRQQPVNENDTECENHVFRAEPLQVMSSSIHRSRDSFLEQKSTSESIQSFGALSTNDPYKSIKMDVRNELQWRLNPVSTYKENSNLETFPKNHLSIKQRPSLIDAKPVFNIPKRNHSVGNIFRQLDRRLSEQNSDYVSQMNLLSLKNLQTKSTCAQSRTFKLLQETLENGLVENDAQVNNSFMKKSQIKRCSLVNSLIPEQTSLKETVSDDQKQFQQRNQNQSQLRKQYIRSLSIARDPSAEPLFLTAKLKAAVERHNLSTSDFCSFDD